MWHADAPTITYEGLWWKPPLGPVRLPPTDRPVFCLRPAARVRPPGHGAGIRVRGMPNDHPHQAPPTAPRPYGGPGQHGAPVPYIPGPYNAPGPYGENPQFAPAPPLNMPSSLRAARTTTFVMVGLALLASVAVGVTDGARGAGAAFGGNIFGVALLVLACFYGRAGRGLRVTSIVIASVQILLGLSGTLRGNIGGPIALVGAVVMVVLLSQASTGAWFRRPRTPGA